MKSSLNVLSHWNQVQKKVKGWSPLFLSLILLSSPGCGDVGFTVMKNNKGAPAPGTYVVPPRVDIAFFIDDSGSMYNAFPSLQGEVPSFLRKLDGQNWDYHFSMSRLTTFENVTQVVGSKYDGNRSDWTPAFPGATRSEPGTLSSSVFRSPVTFTQYPDQSWSSNQRAGYEPGLLTIRDTLQSGFSGTGFLRSDALLVVVVLGNGDDTSYLNLCARADQSLVPCAAPIDPVCVASSSDPTGGKSSCDSRSTSLQFFKNQLLAIHSNTKVFSAVSLASNLNCYGSRAYRGSRYMSLADMMGGLSYDVCSQSVSQVLGALTQSLQGERKSFRTKYIMLDQAPNVSTIQVTKFVGGNSALTQVIPQDANNGWTYSGYLSNVEVIDQPIPMNRQSGFAIELHGTAKLVGDDTANVDWKPEGVRDSTP